MEMSSDQLETWVYVHLMAIRIAKSYLIIIMI